MAIEYHITYEGDPNQECEADERCGIPGLWLAIEVGVGLVSDGTYLCKDHKDLMVLKGLGTEDD